ncbi:MAG TPA: LapA family protein [Solirubrobacterales bacterium]|jgi:uncharacterized integral membrane protein|nr:LapA family protein [Solirubrobacterales bacterium]
MAQEKKPVNWRAWLVGILSALVLIVALQNSQEVSFDVLFTSFNAPLIVVILLAAAIGVLIGYIAPLVRRHRREERHQHHNP